MLAQVKIHIGRIRHRKRHLRFTWNGLKEAGTVCWPGRPEVGGSAAGLW
jgi:hypothetical protein